MSDIEVENPETATQSSVEPPAPVSAPVVESPTAPPRKKETSSLVARFWWVPVSFILPYVFAQLYFSAYQHLAFSAALCARSGLIGLGAASLIFGLWQLDRIIGKTSSRDVQSELLVRMLGIMLWLVWIGAAHIVLVAQDEVTPPDLALH